MRKLVLFMIFVAIAMMSCERAEYSEFSKSEYTRWNFYYQTATQNGVTLMALFDEEKSGQVIPYSLEFVKISCPADFNHQLFLCEKANGEKYLYNKDGYSMLQGPILDENGKTIKDQNGKTSWVPVPYLSHEWVNNNLLFEPFHPGVRLDVKTPRGTLVIFDYNLKCEYGYCKDFVPGQAGCMMLFGKHWWYHRARYYSPQFHKNPTAEYEAAYEEETILFDLDEVYEINAITEQQTYIYGRQGDNWKVYNLEGKEVKNYPSWINKNLPNLARRTFDMTNRTKAVASAPYPKFYGNESAGLIIYKSMDRYQYKY